MMREPVMNPEVRKSPGPFIRALLLTAVVGCAPTLLALAADDRPTTKPAENDQSFEALKKEYDDARVKYIEEKRKEAQAGLEAAQAELKAAEKVLQVAKTVEEKEAAQKRVQNATGFPAMKAISPADGPGETFSPRFLAFAVKNPKAPEAVDAFYWALITSDGPAGKVGTWGRAVKALQVDHVENAELRRAVRLLRVLAGAHDEAADKLLRDVMARNPDRRAQGRACQALA
jgi:hypothetical protein